jgi:protein-export membrane protein SecD
MKTNRYRAPIVLLVFLICFVYVMPTIGLYQRLPDWLAKWLPSKSINLGLDLKGGSYLVYEVDTTGMSKSDADDAVKRALEIIRERVDALGVKEPEIQTEGADKFVVKLAGILDPERAKAVIGQTAMMEFKLVADPKTFAGIISEYDAKVRELYGDKTQDSQLLSFMLNSYGDRYFVYRDDWPVVEKMLNQAKDWGLIPKGVVFHPGEVVKDTSDPLYKAAGGQARMLYLCEEQVEVTGDMLSSAKGSYDQYGKPNVVFEFKSEGSKAFGKLTGNNIGRELAIVLDGVVKSAPVIKARITSNGEISGNFTPQEASDLAMVLRIGALPAPMHIIQEQVVGPSLGRDSIRNGILAAIIGLSLVLLFMVGYYNASGILADFSLFFNMLITAAVLVILGAALTLPGIIGFILSTAMAVDANVLIFERIREEQDLNKTVRACLDTGYKRAFLTILDSNMTTLIGGVALLYFGKGAVKGFAVTLIIGIIASMFTAIVFTKTIYDAITNRFRIKKLYI